MSRQGINVQVQSMIHPFFDNSESTRLQGINWTPGSMCMGALPVTLGSSSTGGLSQQLIAALPAWLATHTLPMRRQKTLDGEHWTSLPRWC